MLLIMWSFIQGDMIYEYILDTVIQLFPPFIAVKNNIHHVMLIN